MPSRKTRGNETLFGLRQLAAAFGLPRSGRRGAGAFTALLATLTLFSPLPTRASHAPPEVIHVKTTPSPSGRYHFEVDPSNRYGAGPSRCTLTENNRTLWSAEVPFTFYEATVLENGTVAGYGYTHGESGLAFNVPRTTPNEIHAVIFDPAGKRLLSAKFPRQVGPYPGSGYVPGVSGILLHDDLFILRIPADKDEDVENWHRYRLSTGETLDTVRPKLPAPDPAATDFRCWLPEARIIPGTPLTALRWMYFNDDISKRFTLFNVVDLTGKSVWELPPLPWNAPPDEAEADRIDSALEKDGAIAIPPFKQFEIWSPGEKTRTLYSVEGQAGAWKVQKLSQRPWTPPPPPKSDEPASLTIPEPKRLGTFILDTPPPDGPVRSVDTFHFDDRGRIGFLRDSTHFVLIEQNGTLVLEMPLGLPDETERALIWTTGDHWLVTASDYGEGSRARAWNIDVREKSLAEIAGFDCPPVKSLAAAGAGGFVAFTSQWKKYSSAEALIAFDAAGKQRWKISTEGGNLFPEDLTVTTKGEVVVLDNIHKVVVMFDAAGTQLRSTDLTKAWRDPLLPKSLQHEPNYPSAITADKDGGFIVTDFDGQSPFVRMTAAGKVRTRFSPRFKDGRLADQSGEIRAAPDGRLWLNNGHALLRLDDKGCVTDVLGQKPDSSALAVIASAACDDAGRICAVDAQTGIVHVFDDSGRRQGLRRPDKKDLAGATGGSSPSIAGDGRILLNTGVSEEHYIMFGSDGKRLPLFLKTGTGDEWSFRQGAGGLLRCGFDEITLADDKGAAQKVITRQPDHRWLDFTTDVAVAPDGSFVAVSGQYRSLNFYSPQGDPRGTIAAPVPGALQLQSWTGTHLLISTEKESLLCDRDGKPLHRLRTGVRGGDRTQFLTRAGREWWMLEFATRKVTRYAVP